MDRTLGAHTWDTQDTVAVDGLGRLLQLNGAGQLGRYAVGRPVAIVGLPPSLQVPTQVELVPTGADATGLLAWLDGEALALSELPWRVTLSPDGLAEGGHELRLLVDPGGAEYLSAHTVWVGALPNATWADVEAISTAHCLRCHGGDTATELSTAADWQFHIDRILEVTESGEMPLGDDPLTEDDLVTIRAWKHGGFP